MQLYEKITVGKTTRYKEYVPPPEPVTYIQFTEGQCITAAGALGLVLMNVFERNIPPHKKVARKIKAVEEAITDLYRNTGQAIDRDIAELMIGTWDRVILELTAEVDQ